MFTSAGSGCLSEGFVPWGFCPWAIGYIHRLEQTLIIIISLFRTQRTGTEHYIQCNVQQVTKLYTNIQLIDSFQC